MTEVHTNGNSDGAASVIVGGCILPALPKAKLQIWLMQNAGDFAHLCDEELEIATLEINDATGIAKTWLSTKWTEAVHKAQDMAPEPEQSADGHEPVGDAEKRPRFKIDGGCITERFGDENVRLCNFMARIVADVNMDDGEGITKRLLIRGLLATGEPLPEITIPADKFGDMSWVVGEWGARAIIESGKSVKDRLRHAVQELSAQAGIEQRSAFTHTGWRIINGKRVFLHAGGAIGCEGVNVDLPHNLACYKLPHDNAVDVVTAMRESIKLLDIAPMRVSAPLWSAMFLGPLTEIITPAFNISVEGGSGSLKSSYSAVMLNHYGAEFHEYNMPADWLGTANSLEKQCFHAKDVVTIIDDLRPTTSPTEAKTLQDAVSRITRAVGNRQGRSRLDSNSEFKRSYSPRGVVMMTAERKALGKSTNSRILTIDVEPGDVDSVKLSVAQKQRHVYGYAMAGYIRWVAERWDELKNELPSFVADERAKSDGNGHHKRLPNATAVLYAAFTMAMHYAIEIGAISQDDAARYRAECRRALQDMAETQNQATEAEDPAQKYVTIIATLVAMNKAYIPGKKEDANLGATMGEKLGWHDGVSVYLLPGAYNAVCRYARDEGWTFPSDESTLRKELDRAGYITKRTGERLTTKQREPGLNDRPVTVTAISYEKFVGILAGMRPDYQ